MARLYALQLADQRAMEKQGVRENPIRRGGYSGGAAPTQPVRFELASERAEEIQANRTNPRRSGATPTMGVSQVRGGNSVGDIMMGFVDPFGFRKMGRGGMSRAEVQAQREASFARMSPERQASYNADMKKHGIRGVGGAMTSSNALKKFRGGRAVPSSGLSQFRGGAGERMVGAGHGSDSDSDSDEECEGMGKYEGMGKLTIIHGGDRGAEVLAREKASRPAIRSGLSAQHSAEAKQMGQHLGSHLLSVKGGGFFELFTKGIVEAGQKGESVAEQTGMPNANAPPPPTGIMTTTTPPTEGDLGGEPTKGSGLPSAAFGRTRKGAGDSKPPEQIALDKMLKKEGAGIFDEMRNRDRDEMRNRDRVVTKPAVMMDNDPFMMRKDPFVKKKLSSRFDPPLYTLKGGKSILGYFGDYVGKHVSNPNSMFHAVAKGVVNNAVPLVDILTKDLKGTGYLSGQYEGMGEDYSEKRRQGLAKRNAANAAAASRRTSAQNEAIAKQQAEMRAVMENQHQLTDAEKRKYSGRRTSGSGVGCGARATRAAIVKKVMAEKGCSMIEASKYVKEHGLYTGGMSGRVTPVGRHIPPRSPPRLRAPRMCIQGENVTPPTDVTGTPAERIQPRPPAELQRGVSERIERFKDEKAVEGLLKLKKGSGYEEAMKIPKKRHVNKRSRKPFVQKPEEEEGYDQSTSMDKDSIRKSFAEKRAADSKKLAVGGKQRRAPAGPSDGRRKRAEIVKKVMAEKGCSMIEASKHVKAHGLY